MGAVFRLTQNYFIQFNSKLSHCVTYPDILMSDQKEALTKITAFNSGGMYNGERQVLLHTWKKLFFSFSFSTSETEILLYSSI